MPAKRARVGRSTSIGVFDQLPPPLSVAEPSDRNRVHVRTHSFGNAAKSLKPSPAEGEQSRPRILTLSTPEAVRMGREAQVEKFLDECFFCHKWLPHNEDVFMYGPFRAFCSPECREQQIEIDKKAEQASGEAATTMYSATDNVNERLSNVPS